VCDTNIRILMQRRILFEGLTDNYFDSMSIIFAMRACVCARV